GRGNANVDEGRHQQDQAGHGRELDQLAEAIGEQTPQGQTGQEAQPQGPHLQGDEHEAVEHQQRPGAPQDRLEGQYPQQSDAAPGRLAEDPDLGGPDFLFGDLPAVEDQDEEDTVQSHRPGLQAQQPAQGVGVVRAGPAADE